MSLDHIVYAETRRRSMRSVRAAAKRALARHPGWTLAASDHDGDEDELHIVGLGGPIDVTEHDFGVSFAVSSTTGARNHFVELGELANEIAAELGTVLDESAVARLLEAEDPPMPARTSATPLLASRIVIVLHGPDGEQLHRVTCSHQQFSVQQSGDGLRPELVDRAIPAVLGEQGRLAYRARSMTCTAHGQHGDPTISYRYSLDGYGRIVSVDVTRY